MYLQKLEIKGFKSFAKKTVLEFEQGITSVVGPNGSGKSNIADSLRWAFGEQSMKLLRGKKSEDMIFAGSEQKARMGFAEVTVQFDNKDRIMPIDYSEVVIGRRLYRDGRSEYLINNNQVRLLDIQELLAKSGFAQSSYHVIGQGMIDQMILGGPQAIKEIIEEASGIKPYYIKRHRALLRLDRTENNLEQVRALIKEIQPRLRSLRRQTKRLERRAEIEAELKAAQTAHFREILQGLQKQISEVDSKLAVFDKSEFEISEEMKVLSRGIESEEQNGQTGGESFRKLRDSLSSLHQEKQKLLEEQALLRGKIRAREFQPKGSFEVDWKRIKNRFHEAFSKFKDMARELKAGPLNQARIEALAGEVENAFESFSLELDRDQDDAVIRREEEEKLGRLEDLIKKLEQAAKRQEAELQTLTEKEAETKKQLFVKERLLRNKQDTLLKTKDEKNNLSIERAKLATRKETYEEEARQIFGEAFREAIASHDGPIPAGLQEKISRLRAELEQIGGVDDLTLQEYKETEERNSYLTEQLKDLEKGMADLKKVIAELDRVIKTEFNEAFKNIYENFQNYFRILFGGGRATMSILRAAPKVGDEEEGEEFPEENLPGESQRAKEDIVGIQISATPPGKKLAGIAALSGGERALTAIALLSALLASYPTPFVVLDEVDAALDEANSIRFGNILGKIADRTQFITITHNRETMRQSHTLYGVTMDEQGVSQILSLKMEQAAVYSTKN